MTEFEKIDLLRARLGISYREAKEALDEAGGDALAALINAEEKQGAHKTEMVDELKEWVRRGTRSRLRVKKGEDTVFEVPGAVGAAGVLAALASTQIAVLGVVGLLTAMTKNYSLEIEDGGATGSKSMSKVNPGTSEGK